MERIPDEGARDLGHTITVEEVERALLEACRRGHAEIIEFTVAPRSPCPDQPSAGHEWLIEFAEPPRAPATFLRMLDETLQHLNAHYRAQRAASVGLVAPHVLELPAGTFYRLIRERRGLGEMRRVPRVSSDRAVADAILSIVSAQGRAPLVATG